MPRPLFAIALHAQIAKKSEGPKYNPPSWLDANTFLLDRNAWDNGEYLCVSRIKAMPGVTTMFYIKWHRFYRARALSGLGQRPHWAGSRS
jgi:hypothetical protein